MIDYSTRIARLEIGIKEQRRRQGLFVSWVPVADALPRQTSHCERRYRLVGLI